MYESFYGLKEKPFNLLPDPEYLYMSPGHENAYTHLEYAIAENKGFVVITGEIGSGKTTLINYLLGKIPQDIQVGIINNTDVEPLQFLKMICREFELEANGQEKAEILDSFNSFLLDQFSRRHRVVLIIDEAQNLPNQTIEEIRMLSNLEAEKNHLIQVILVGQPELKYKLRGRSLAQFAQRVTVHCHLGGLSRADVEKYIRHRLRVAGAKSLDIFDQNAIDDIHKYSRGIPRIINTLCDTALVYGFADDVKVINKKIIENIVESREIGEGFTEDAPGEDAALPSPPMGNGAAGQLNGRVDSLEKRMVLLETVVANIERTLSALVNKREKRDNIVIELFEMLKQSLESRRRLAIKYNDLKQSVAGNKQETVKMKKEPKTSFFSRLAGKD